MGNRTCSCVDRVVQPVMDQKPITLIQVNNNCNIEENLLNKNKIILLELRSYIYSSKDYVYLYCKLSL